MLAGLAHDAEIVVPHARGHRQPLAAAYRVELAPSHRRAARAGLAKPGFLYERSRTRFVDDAWLLADARRSRGRPGLASLENLNDPEAYAAALALPRFALGA